MPLVWAQQAPLTLDNNELQVVFDPATSSFSVLDKTAGYT
jgi:hypothetical protein